MITATSDYDKITTAEAAGIALQILSVRSVADEELKTLATNFLRRLLTQVTQSGPA